MRIRHYFNQQPISLNSSSYDPVSAHEKKFSTLPTKHTREKTSQTIPKKPIRTSNKKAQEEKNKVKATGGGSSKLLSSQSLRISASVPSLGVSKGLGETDDKVSFRELSFNKDRWKLKPKPKN